MKKIMFILSILMASDVFACTDPTSETRTFFKSLPEKLKKKSESVAKIKIISTKLKSKRVTNASIIKAIKGMKKFKSIIIISDGQHSCNKDPEIIKGQEYFIAGVINEKGVFKGVWKGFFHNF